MFRIGEFSKLVRVSSRMLRYYDKCSLLRPAETDRYTGYRLYSAAQIPVMARITALRDIGFGLDEIDELLPYYDNAAKMRKALELKSDEIRLAIAAEQSKLEKIADMGRTLEKGCAIVIYDVELKTLKAEKVLSLREIISAYDKEGEQWEKLWGYMEKNGIAYGGGGYSIYHDDEFKESDVDVEIAVSVAELGQSEGAFKYMELDAIPLAATIRFSGPYEGYGDAIEKLASWVEDNGYVLDGTIRGLGIVMPTGENSPEDI